MTPIEKTNFPVNSGFLSPHHVGNIGAAIWIFLWLIDRTTSDEIHDGERWGVVLYGQVIRSEQMMRDTGFSARTCREHLQRLEAAGYISLDRKTSVQVNPGAQIGKMVAS